MLRAKRIRHVIFLSILLTNWFPRLSQSTVLVPKDVEEGEEDVRRDERTVTPQRAERRRISRTLEEGESAHRCYERSRRLSCGIVQRYQVCERIDRRALEEERRMPRLDSGENKIPGCSLSFIHEKRSRDDQNARSSFSTKQLACTSSSFHFSAHLNFTGKLFQAVPLTGCAPLQLPNVEMGETRLQGTFSVTYESRPLGFALSDEGKGAYRCVVNHVAPAAAKRGIRLGDRIFSIGGKSAYERSFQWVAKAIRHGKMPMIIEISRERDSGEEDVVKNDDSIDGSSFLNNGHGPERFGLLMRRGGCEFHVKAKHASDAGAAVLVVVDEQSFDRRRSIVMTSPRAIDEEQGSNMGNDSPELTSVSVPKSTGETLFGRIFEERTRRRGPTKNAFTRIHLGFSFARS